jgi:hypothetical protein
VCVCVCVCVCVVGLVGARGEGEVGRMNQPGALRYDVLQGAGGGGGGDPAPTRPRSWLLLMRCSGAGMWRPGPGAPAPLPAVTLLALPSLLPARLPRPTPRFPLPPPRGVGAERPAPTVLVYLGLHFLSPPSSTRGLHPSPPDLQPQVLQGGVGLDRVHQEPGAVVAHRVAIEDQRLQSVVALGPGGRRAG